MAKKPAPKKKAPAGRENVRVRGKSLPEPFPPETCERLRNLAKHASKADTEKARATVARDAKTEEIAQCGEDEVKKLDRLKSEGWDLEREIERWHGEAKWARNELIATVEGADDLKLIHDPDWEDPRPPEPGDADEETPQLKLHRGDASSPNGTVAAPKDTGPPHWSQRWAALWRDDAAGLAKPTPSYLKDLSKAGIDSPGAFLAAIRMNAKENAPLLRNVEPAAAAGLVLAAIEARRKSDDVAGAPSPAAWSKEVESFNATLGAERLAALGEMVKAGAGAS